MTIKSADMLIIDGLSLPWSLRSIPITETIREDVVNLHIDGVGDGKRFQRASNGTEK